MKRRNRIIRQKDLLLLWLSALFIGFTACNNPNQQDQNAEDTPHIQLANQLSIDHAIGFDVLYHKDWKEVQLFRHYNDFIDTVRYALTYAKSVAGFEPSHTIQIPAQRIGALSTTQLGMFDLLDAFDQLTAIEVRRYVYNEKIKALVEEGAIQELAPSGKLNLEATIAADLDLLMGVGYPNSQNKDYQTLQRTGLPVMLIADWQETSLLGRAEWIKLLAALLDKENEVNAIFQQIESEYDKTIALIEDETSERPSTITGLANGDSWYVAGGNSFANGLLRELNVDYPWDNTEETGSIRLDFETVYSAGLIADYWLVPSTAKSLDEILKVDERYADFKAYQEERIYNIYGRYTPGGGNDYYESAIVAPQVVLKDMVKIFYPRLLPDHQLVYYNRLQ